MSEQKIEQEELKIEVTDKRKPGWFWIDNDFIKIYLKIVGLEGLAIYAVLCKYANSENIAFPYQKQICEETGISEPTVIKFLKILKEYNFIKIQKVWKRNKYQLTSKDEWKVINLSSLSSSTKAALVDNITITNITRTNLINNLTKVKSLITKPNGFGNPEINFLLTHLKEKFSLKRLDGSEQQNRNYTKLAIKKFGSKENVANLIDIASKDSFWDERVSSMKDIYYNGVKIELSLKNNTLKVIKAY